MSLSHIFLAGFIAVSLAVWVYRTARALRTLRFAPSISVPALDAHRRFPMVSVIIPAKNEENNIRSCVEDLLNQDYLQHEIIVVNDNSSDETESILISLGAQKIDPASPADSRNCEAKLKYLNSAITPEGWTGKNHAIHQAIPAAQGEWFLFTDADTRHEPSGLRSSVTHALNHDLSLLTLLPRCLAGSFMERTIQPTAMGLTGLWFPLERINNPEDPMYFGNGQYLLIKKDLYAGIGGHQNVRDKFLEDFALVKAAKELKAGVQCALGPAVYGTRMYDSFQSIWRGWRRIYLHGFESQPGPLIRRAASCLLFSVGPCLLFPFLSYGAVVQAASWLALWAFLLPVIIILFVTAWRTYGIVKAEKSYAFLHPVAGFFISLILLDAAHMALTNKKTLWR